MEKRRNSPIDPENGKAPKPTPRYFPIEPSTITERKVGGIGEGVIGSFGWSISPTSEIIAGTAFTALPFSDAGTYHGFVGLPTTEAPWPAWDFQQRTWERDAPMPPQGGTVKNLTGMVKTLPRPRRPTNTSARGVNDNGDLVGWWQDPLSASHIFVWPNGSPVPDLRVNPILDAPNVVFPQDSKLHNAAYGINDIGTVVGQYCLDFPATAGKSVPLYTHFGFVGEILNDVVKVRAENLDAVGTSVRGINASGHIVGRYEIWDDTAPPPPGGMSPITTKGLVSIDRDHNYADCREVQLPDHPNANLVVVGGINDAGQIVGHIRMVANGPLQGFLWQIDKDGNTILDPTLINYSDFDPAYTSTQLNFVDNKGIMIGTATGDAIPPKAFLCRLEFA